MDGNSSSGFGVNLIAYIRAEMGLGTAARGIAHALESASVPFNIINFEHSNPSLHRNESWRHKEVASSAYDFTLLAVNPDNISNARTRVQKKFVKDQYTIGYWFWELPEIPDDWQASFALVDEVWAGSRFIQDAISLRSTVPVFRVPVPICAATPTQFSRQNFSLPEDKFLFLSMSDTHSHLARKNPLGVIAAFKKAFSGDNESVGLVLKLSNVNTADADAEMIELIRDEASGHTNIYLMESDLLGPEIEGLLAVCDSFVSLHRSEGFGLGPAEAMSLGKPVVLTKWSGNTDYMTPSNSIGIDYELIPVGKQYGPYAPDQLWAEPDLEQAAFWMRRLAEDQDFARKTGALGQETISQEFSPEAVGKIINRRLQHLRRTGFGRHLHKTKASDATAVIQLQSFASRAGVSDIDQLTTAEVTPGQWCRLKIDLPWGIGDGSAPFRFDPVDRPGLVDLAAVTLRATASRNILWRANTRIALEELSVRGTALCLPHERLLRFLSYGEDPQVYLPHLTEIDFGEPLTLEILLRFDPTPQNVERAVSGLRELAIDSSRLASTQEVRPLVLPQPPEEPFAIPAEEPMTMVVYSAGESGYSEERSTRVTYARDRWSHLDIALQLGLGSTPLRLDPSTTFGLIDFAALTIRSAIDDEVLWQANGGGQLDSLQVSGSAVRIPHPNLVRVLSYGSDPQVYLPAFSSGKFDGPLRLQVWVKTETGIDSIRKGISELALVSSQALAASSQAQGMLEESGRAVADKEDALETVRSELETVAREREEALVRASEIAQGEKAALAQTIAALKADLDHAGRELASAQSELKLTTGEFDKTRAGLRKQVAETKMQASLVERLRQEIRVRGLQQEEFARELALLKGQLAVEHAGKTLLMEEFSRAGEKIRCLKQDLSLVRQAASRQTVSRFRDFLGTRQKNDLAPEPEPPAQPDGSLYRFWIDSPNGPAPLEEKVYFSGWVLPPPGEKVLGVRGLVRGEIFVGQYGFERSDVAAAFSDLPDASDPGFSVALPLPVGVHEVALQALATSGKWVTFCLHQHEVLSENSPKETLAPRLPQEGAPPANTKFEGWLESPGDETMAENGLLLVTGWLLLKTGQIQELFASIGDGPKIRLAHSLARNDVALHLPHLPSSRHSGFEGYIPLASNCSGSIDLVVAVVQTNGEQMVCFRREVMVQAPPLLPNSVPFSEISDEERYARWVDRNTLTPYLLDRMARDGASLASTGPRISLLVPTFNTPAPYLEALIESVTKQVYKNWQLCFADDASTEPHVRALLERAVASDTRIEAIFRETNGHIAQASNSALQLAKGDYVGLLDHDDLLSPDALLHVAEAVVADRSLDLLYTDEDKLSPEGRRFDPIFKGAFSPEMSLTHNYIQHFTVIRRSLLDELGGFRAGFEGAQDLDLYLRVLEKTTPERVKHLPFVCYHWRSHPKSTASSGSEKGYVFDSARTSISEALGRRGLRAIPFLPGWAEATNCCLYQLKWSPDLLKENPVTVIIPTKNRADLLRKCIARLEETVDPAHVRIVVVDDFSDEAASRSYLKGLEAERHFQCRVIRPEPRFKEFNFSYLINEGVAAAETRLVLLLNNDTEALYPGWLEEMVGWMSIDGVGAVGAKLLYADNTIQHAGVIIGAHGGLAEHIFHRLPKDVIGFNFLTHAARNVSAVTGACLLTSKSAFEQIGGFDQDALGMEYNDVDFCVRLTRAGKRVVFTPQAELIHYCGQTRLKGWRPAEHLNFLDRYRGLKDPYYNENLDFNRTPVTVNPEHFLHRSRVGKLKVLMVSHNLNLEGAPKVLFDHAAYFAKTGGYDVTLVSREDGPLREKVEEAGITVKILEGALPETGEGTVAYLGRLFQIGADLEVGSFDLIVCNTLTSFWGVVLAGIFNRPVIWHVHESTTIEQFFYFAPVSTDLVESCFSSADRVVFEANATRSLLSRYQKKDNFTTISGSIDVSAINAFREQHSQRSMKIKHGIDPEKIVISLIGTTCPRKGQHVFIQAIALLQEQIPAEIDNICFIMLGARESSYLDLLHSQLKSIQGTDTRLIEERHDIFDFYRLSDIFVCASFQESFPRVLLEAMAFKLAIVSTKVFGIPEMVEHEGEGLLVPPGDAAGLADALAQLIQASKDRADLGEKGHAKVTRLFNSPTQLSRQLDLTKEVVARHV